MTMKKCIKMKLGRFLGALAIVAICLVVSACGSSTSAEGIYTPGTYSGSGKGMGPITVDITVTSDAITEVVIKGTSETAGVGGKEAIESGVFAEEILETQSADIDTISGATLTCNGVKEATEEALELAKK